MDEELENLRARSTAFGVEIYRTELLLDEAVQILEEMRTERARINVEIARMMLEEAIDFPGEIYT